MRRPGDTLRADGVRIDANVECGAVQNLRWVKGLYGDPLVCFEAPRDGSPQGMWWRFRVRGAAGRRIWFHLTNVPEVLGGGGLGEAVPVIRERGGKWLRLDPAVCEKLGPRGPFQFVVDFAANDVELAWCYPYGPSDFARFVKSLPAGRKKLLKLSRVCTSAEGRPLKMVTTGSSTAKEMKPAIWVTARNHAGEVAGSWGIEGLLRELSGSSPAAKWLRKHCVVHAVPFVDIDSVAEGRYGKEHVPRDPNRDWSAGSIRPETSSIVATVESSRRKERPAVLVDLHCPGAGEPKSYPVLPNPTGLADWSRIAFLAKCAERAAPREFPVRVREWTIKTVNWASWLSPGTTCNWARDAGMTAITFEMTYNRTVRDNLATPELYVGFGASLVEALARFMKYEVSGRATPKTKPPRVPRARGWLTRRLPERASLSSGPDGGARIRGRGKGSYVVVRTNETFPARRREAVFTLESVNRSRRPVELSVVVLPRTRDGYWCGYYLERRVKIRPGRSRRRLGFRLRRGGAGFRVGLEVRDLAGQLDLRVTPI
ncbi:MAG: M14 family zinc carboxypeptidase [Planctomycetota bacterium]|jgi:predicted deacylase